MTAPLHEIAALLLTKYEQHRSLQDAHGSYDYPSGLPDVDEARAAFDRSSEEFVKEMLGTPVVVLAECFVRAAR